MFGTFVKMFSAPCWRPVPPRRTLVSGRGRGSHGYLAGGGHADVALSGSGSNGCRVPSRSRVKASRIRAESSGRGSAAPRLGTHPRARPTLANAQADHGHAVTLSLTIDGGRAVRAEQIARRITVDFPGRERMRISHEALYLYRS